MLAVKKVFKRERSYLRTVPQPAHTFGQCLAEGGANKATALGIQGRLAARE